MAIETLARTRPTPPSPPASSACAVATAAARSRSALSYVCPACFGPLEVDVRLRRRRRDAHPRGDRGARPGHLALRRAAPGRRAADARPAGRLDAAARRRSARARRSGSSGCGSRTTPATRRCASRTGRSRSPPPAPSSSASRRWPAPRPATWPARPPPRPRRVGLPAYVFIPADLEPAKVDHALAYGATVVPIDGHLRRRQPALPRGRRRDRLGLRQHQPAAVLRRGLQDPRLRDRRIARLALARRRRRAGRVGRDVHPRRARASRSSPSSG